jgi:hypothetical protein
MLISHSILDRFDNKRMGGAAAGIFCGYGFTGCSCRRLSLRMNIEDTLIIILATMRSGYNRIY